MFAEVHTHESGSEWEESKKKKTTKKKTKKKVVRVKEPRGFLVKGRRPTSAINRGGFNKVAKQAAGGQIAPRG